MSDSAGKKRVSYVRGFLAFWGIVTASFGLASEVPSQITGLDLVSGKSFTFRFSESGPSKTTATVLVFMSTRCPCSASHQPALNQIVKEYGSKGIQLFGVHSNANESPEEAGAFFSQAQLSFPVLQDSGSILADQLGAFKTPHVFVLNPKGEVVFQGGVDDSKIAEKATRHFLKEALNEILQGRLPKDSNVRVVGCQIQRH